MRKIRRAALADAQLMRELKTLEKDSFYLV